MSVENNWNFSKNKMKIFFFFPRRVVASCHLEVAEAGDREDPVQHNMMVARQVKEFFHREGIHSTTIQLEFIPGSGSDGRQCQFECPAGSDLESQAVNMDCLESSCCRERLPHTTSRGA